MYDRWHPKHRKGLPVSIPASLYRDIYHARIRFGFFGEPASMATTITALLRAGVSV